MRACGSRMRSGPIGAGWSRPGPELGAARPPPSAPRRPGSTTAASYFVLEMCHTAADRTEVQRALSGEKSAMRSSESTLSFFCSPCSGGGHRAVNWLAGAFGFSRSGIGAVDPCSSEVSGRNSGAARVLGPAARFRLFPSGVSGGSHRIPDMKRPAGLAFVVTHPCHPSAPPPRGFSHSIGPGHLPLARFREFLRRHQNRIVAVGCHSGRSGQRQAAAAGSEPATARKPASGRREAIGGTLQEPKIVARAMREHPRAVADTLRRWRQ